MPDVEIKGKNIFDKHSLYELIERFIATDKYLINEFYREGDKAIYGYRFYCEEDNDWREDFSIEYSSFDKMKESLDGFDFLISKIEYRKNI